MIDSREPKDGDFASYVEGLVKAPVEQNLPGRDQAPSARGQPAPGAHEVPQPPRMALGRHGDPAARPPEHESLEARLQRLRHALPDASSGELEYLVRRVAGVASLIGLALILLSFVDNPPFFADPLFGILLIAAGTFVNRFLKKLR